ncbi:Halotolerance protein 9 [Madurella fahalii]|uniref:Halotolerance protein 9 n=1 Tax=Madurella fahalii TaxID=1157608 RepID=A0ABQ0FZN7_9PEZI
MAVVAPPSLKSTLDPWRSGDSAIYPAAPPAEPMTDVMSYQYPPPPHNGADMDLPPSGYLPSYSVPSHASSGMDPSIPSRERSDSFSKSIKLKRSMPTPVVGPPQPQAQAPQPPPPQQSAAPGQDPAGERRRNKLGYHRTSVACGHCRRRKIRCVPSQNDVQGRCINCIRLKKECSFYPVDQQPPLDTRQKSASRSSVGPKIASASSSPAMQTGIPSDIHGQQPYPQLTMPSMQSMPPPMKPSGTESYGPDSKIPSSASSSRTYEYGHHGMTNWMSADASPSSSKPSDLNATWRSYPADSPITPAFSPYTPHAPPPSATWSASVGSEPSSRDDIAWSSYPAPPSRSLSFGAESMTSHQQYPSMSSRSYDRKSSSVSADMYQPPIATTIPGIETVPGTTIEQNVSLSAGAVPPSSYASWQQSYSYSKPTEGYGGWYGETGTHQPLGSGDQHSSGHGHSGSNVYYGR